MTPFSPGAEGNADNPGLVLVDTGPILVILGSKLGSTQQVYPCFRILQCVAERPEIGFAHPDIGEAFADFFNGMTVGVLDECNRGPVIVPQIIEIVLYGF
ncbi:MAG: hypothetical protein KAX31_02315, partial [Thermoplasmata archaeon]|nr:hypothetical protein [Thermoplasmata archaeon]